MFTSFVPQEPKKDLRWQLKGKGKEKTQGSSFSSSTFHQNYEPNKGNLLPSLTFPFFSIRSKPNKLRLEVVAKRLINFLWQEILESFQDREYWYVEEGNLSDNSRRIGSFRWIIAQPLPRKEEKWWLPVPRVPYGGLSEKSRKHLKHKRDCAFQIHKAAMAINSSILAEMEVPETYLASLPKSGKASVGDSIYHYMWTAQEFSPDNLLDCLNVSTEHEALELADQVEASIYIWRRKTCESHSSWTMVKDLVSDTDRTDKYAVLAQRAESLLFCLKQRYPELSQTTLDTSKIQYNMDVGQAILESYSRVLEGLAFNIVAWIEDVLYVDKIH